MSGNQKDECPQAEEWLTPEQLESVRAQVKLEVGDVNLTTVEDIFSVFNPIGNPNDRE